MSVMFLVSPAMAARRFSCGLMSRKSSSSWCLEGQRDGWLTGPYVRLSFLGIQCPGIRDDILDL